MKLKVPFVKNKLIWKGKGWCGPLALASLLRYYKDKTSVTDIVKLAQTHKNGGSVPHGLINICLKKGMNVIYYAKNEFEKNNNPKYSKRLQKFLKHVDAEKSDKIFWMKNKKFKTFKFIKKGGTMDNIYKFLDQGKPVLIINNVALLFNKDKMWPHYLIVVGYDEDNFYVHNVAIKNQKFQKVNKKLLEMSWSSEGLDKALIVPYFEK